MKLNDRQREVLERTLSLIDDSGWDGYCPSDIADRSTVAALVRRGLMRFVGYGQCMDESVPNSEGRDVAIYELTEEGRRIAEAFPAGEEPRE